MIANIETPNIIVNKINELNNLITEYPISIPLEKAAAFLNTDGESLKAAIQQGKCSFAYCWQKTIKGYRAFKIPTVTFYLWYTNGRI